LNGGTQNQEKEHGENAQKTCHLRRVKSLGEKTDLSAKHFATPDDKGSVCSFIWQGTGKKNREKNAFGLQKKEQQ